MVEAPWSLRGLEQTLQVAYGTTPRDPDLSPELSFVAGVVSLAKTRYYRSKETSATAPVIFLLHPKDPPALPEGHSQFLREPMLQEGMVPIGGRMWFVNQIVSSGVPVDVPSTEAFAETVDWICHLPGLGDVPAAVIDLRQDRFVAAFYPRGFNDPDAMQRCDLLRGALAPAELREAIDGIYDNLLCSPDAQGHTVTTWKDKDRWIPVEEPELTVQKILKSGLTGRFLGIYRVLEEQPSPSGRFDLLIEEPDPTDRSQVTRHAILELKVLKSMTTGGRSVAPNVNAKAINKGVTQAAVYRDDHGARFAALCCFDMRRDRAGESMFGRSQRSRAVRRHVELWCWHMFASADAYRAYRDELALAGIDEEM